MTRSGFPAKYLRILNSCGASVTDLPARTTSILAKSTETSSKEYCSPTEGRVGRLYRDYLRPDDPVPAWHGHLHNNLAQVAAEFGAPVLLAALLFTLVLFRHLCGAWKLATTRDTRFLARAGLLSLIGFVIAGMFDYTYGHALALILIGFAAFSPLIPASCYSWDESGDSDG
jgi:hypothetical protein